MTFFGSVFQPLLLMWNVLNSNTHLRTKTRFHLDHNHRDSLTDVPLTISYVCLCLQFQNKTKSLYLHTPIFSHHTALACFSSYYYFIIGIQPLGRSGQRPELSQTTGIALVRSILGKFLGVACHCFPPLFRCSHLLFMYTINGLLPL